MDAAEVALADAKDEVSLGENTMDAMVVDESAALVLGFQRGAENGQAISKSRVVLGVDGFVDKIRNPVEMSVDKHDFNERSN